MSSFTANMPDGSLGETHASSVSGGMARAVASFALCLIAMWYQGSVLCRSLDLDTEASRLAAALLVVPLCLAVLAVVRVRPSVVRPRAWTIASCICAVAVVPLVLLAVTPSLVAAFVIYALCAAWSMSLCLAALADMDAPHRRNALFVAAVVAAGVSSACVAPLPGPDYLAAHVLAALSPTGVALLSGRAAGPVLDRIRTAGAIADIELTQPASFLPFSSRLFVALMLLGCAVGSSYSVLSRSHIPLGGYQLAGGLLFVAVLAAVVLAHRGRPTVDQMYWPSIALAFVGMLLGTSWPVGTSSVGTVAGVCMIAATLLFYVVQLDLFSTMSSRNVLGIVTLSVFGAFSINLGLMVDALFWLGAVSLRAAEWGSSEAIAVALLIVFMVYNLVVLHDYDFEGTARSLRPVEEVRLVAYAVAPAVAEAPNGPLPARAETSAAASRRGIAPDATDARLDVVVDEASDAADDSDAPTLDDQSTSVADRFCLTARETDVLRLLARGYSGVAIQERLCVSRNTVKTHVRNVYAKLGVHSQQELIDLVESA